MQYYNDPAISAEKKMSNLEKKKEILKLQLKVKSNSGFGDTTYIVSYIDSHQVSGLHKILSNIKIGKQNHSIRFFFQKMSRKHFSYLHKPQK